MLSKLFKYEIKATARLFIPLYLTLLIFSLINRFLLPISRMNNSPSTLYHMAFTIAMSLYVLLIAGTMVITLFVMIQRFYKNLLGDEGYLMLTLPVQSWKHILCKLFVSMGWTLISSIVAVCSVLIIASQHITPDFFRDFFSGIGEIKNYLGSTAYLIGFELILGALLSLASTILMIYAAIALGHLFNKYKLLASFGMYLALNMLTQIVVTLVTFVFINPGKYSFTYSSMPSPADISIFFLFSILCSVAVNTAYFMLTNYVLKKKLNLE